jgi:hypothetical protein
MASGVAERAVYASFYAGVMREVVFPQSLADEVVQLRGWRAEDVPSKLMLFADPSVARFSWPEQRPYTEADAWHFSIASRRPERLARN